MVDNGSTDGSAEMAERLDLPFPLRVLRNSENHSFSDANDQGVEVAAGSLICLLNNDVDPITEDWLGYMVETLTTRDAAAVGARLIYPRHRGGRRAGTHFADLSLQHDGVTFDRTEPIPIPRVMGAGETAVRGGRRGRRASGPDRRLPARPPSLVRPVDGFTPDYDYGLEDIDLCLRLREAGGRLVYDGRAALWHHESATRAADAGAYKARVAGNREVYVDRGGRASFVTRSSTGSPAAAGSRASRSMSRSPSPATIPTRDWRLVHGPRAGRCAGGPRLARLVPGAAQGRLVRTGPVDRRGHLAARCLDIRRLPRHLVTMAWVRNWPERWLARPWFDDYDLVFASTSPSTAWSAPGAPRSRPCSRSRPTPSGSPTPSRDDGPGL